LHIIIYGGLLLNDLNDVVKSLNNNDFYKFGYDFADIIYRVLIYAIQI